MFVVSLGKKEIKVGKEEIKLTIIVIFVLLGIFVDNRSDLDKARDLMNNSHYDEAIELLERAKMDRNTRSEANDMIFQINTIVNRMEEVKKKGEEAAEAYIQKNLEEEMAVEKEIIERLLPTYERYLAIHLIGTSDYDMFVMNKIENRAEFETIEELKVLHKDIQHASVDYGWNVLIANFETLVSHEEFTLDFWNTLIEINDAKAIQDYIEDGEFDKLNTKEYIEKYEYVKLKMESGLTVEIEQED